MIVDTEGTRGSIAISTHQGEDEVLYQSKMIKCKFVMAKVALDALMDVVKSDSALVEHLLYIGSQTTHFKPDIRSINICKLSAAL